MLAKIFQLVSVLKGCQSCQNITGKCQIPHLVARVVLSPPAKVGAAFPWTVNPTGRLCWKPLTTERAQNLNRKKTHVEQNKRNSNENNNVRNENKAPKNLNKSTWNSLWSMEFRCSWRDRYAKIWQAWSMTSPRWFLRGRWVNLFEAFCVAKKHLNEETWHFEHFWTTIRWLFLESGGTLKQMRLLGLYAATIPAKDSWREMKRKRWQKWNTSCITLLYTQ